MKSSRSVADRHLATGTKPRPKADPRGLAWCHAGKVERTAIDVERVGKGKSIRTTRIEKHPYVTLRDFSRYPGPVLKELSKRLPRRLRAAPAALAQAA